MPYVKLDTAILNSTLWFERLAREIFITSLLMAEPHELVEETEALEVDSLKPTGFKVCPGWYGFVPAAGIGILRRALLEDTEEMRKAGFEALKYLGSPDHESRSKEHQGRRMVRVDGGFIILNYFKYRDKDHTNSERQRRWRDRKRNTVTVTDNSVTLRENVTKTRYITEAEADVHSTVPESTKVLENGQLPESTKVQAQSAHASLPKGKRKCGKFQYSESFETFWKAYPDTNASKFSTFKIWNRLKPPLEQCLEAISVFKKSDEWKRGFVEHPTKWLRGLQWELEES